MSKLTCMHQTLPASLPQTCGNPSFAKELTKPQNGLSANGVDNQISFTHSSTPGQKSWSTSYSNLPYMQSFLPSNLLKQKAAMRFIGMVSLLFTVMFVGSVQATHAQYLQNVGPVTVTTDKPDYAPRSTAVFSGTGFQPFEDVQLKVKNLFRPCNTITADSSYLPWTVKTDANGDFVTAWLVCDCSGDSLRLKATGQTSSYIAYAYFSDADVAGDYRSAVAAGNWSSLSSWQRFNGTSWVTPTSTQGYPFQNASPATVTIQNSHNITLDVSHPTNTVGALIVNGTLSANSGTNDLTISNNGSVTVNSTGSIIFNSSSVINGGSTGNSGVVLAINSGAKLTTANVNGFTRSLSNNVVGTGSFAMNNGNKPWVYNANVHYTFTGNGSTGNGISQNTPGNITIDNSGNIVSLAENTNTSGLLTVKAGSTFDLGAFSLGATTAPSGLIIESGTTAGGSIIGSGILSLGGMLTVSKAGTGAVGASISAPILLKVGTRSFNVEDDGTPVVDLSISGAISGSGAILLKLGAGTLILSGDNTYTATTRVTEGVLQLGAADRISNSSNIHLEGGTFKTGAAIGFSETVGYLTLTANSTIALGTGSHTLTFANSSGLTWSGTALTITGWTGIGGATGSGGKIFFGNSNNTLTAAQLAKINFDGYSGTPILLSTGELVPPTQCSAPTISNSPSDVTVSYGTNATFTTSTSGTTPTAYVWQVSTDNGNTWNNVSGTQYATRSTGGGPLHQRSVGPGHHHLR